MTGQPGHQSRRSLSIFSISHIRSLSRAGTHPDKVSSPQLPARSPSSFSCDPYNQPPPTPLSTAKQPLVLPESPPAKTSKLNFLPVSPKSPNKSEDRQQRPRSWFSLSRPSFRGLPARSLSARLPKDTSTSAIGRSVISAPILTGTTNIDVAEAEGVCCRDVVDVGLTAEAETAKSPREVDKARVRLFSNRPQPGGLARKEGNNDKTTKGVLPNAPPSYSGRKSEDTWRFSAVERGIARRRAETVNLCREKINKLTGHGRIKRKSINKGRKNTYDAVDGAGNDDIVDKAATSQVAPIPAKFLSLNNTDSDLAFGSLTRSFASAVDKLDFHSTPPTDRMSFIRSKSSIFNLKKKTKPGAVVDKNTTDPPQQKTKPANQSQVTAQDDTKIAAQGAASMEMMKQLQQSRHHQSSNLVGSPAEPLQFSEAANAYVPAEPAPQYPKGVKVLGMHSNVMEFARPPSWVTDLPVPSQHTPTVEEVTPVDDDEEEQVIEAAPIYSPSLGDLSQYARSTPPSVQPIVKDTDIVPETPSRVQAEKSYLRRLGLRKSKSGSGLLSMFKQGQKEEHKQPLVEQDNGHKKEKAQHLKKSRSMNLAALLRRGETASPKKSLTHETPTVPSQPIRPSPLRFETTLDDTSIESASLTHGIQKRTPPRGNITPSDRAKRMGIVGMPKEDFSDYDKEE